MDSAALKKSKTKSITISEATGARSCLLIHPESNRWLRRWEYISFVALVYVCFVTPYEVAFLKLRYDPLFYINRLWDAIFFVDLVLQFFIMQEVKHRYGYILIVDQRVIAKRYMKSWFIIDFVSAVPFDIMGIWLASSDVARLKLFRTIRLLRLLKLTKLIRGIKLIRQFEVTGSFPYRKMTLLRLMMGVTVVVHWTSCVLGLTSSVQGEACLGSGDMNPDCIVTWVTLAVDDNLVGHRPGETASTLAIYLISLHTATTIVIHPHASTPTSSAEIMVFLVLLCFGGWIWTAVISRSNAISMSLDRYHIAHNQVMDDLNYISNDLKLSTNLQRRLRRFFLSDRHSCQRETWNHLYDRLSPHLQGEVSRELNRAWLRQVAFLHECSPAMLTDLSRNLRHAAFCQGEHFGVPLTLHIMERGLASRDNLANDVITKTSSGEKGSRRPSFSSDSGTGRSKGIRIRRPGSVWGEEHLLLSAWWLLDSNASHALTFVEVILLTRERFDTVVGDHPEHRPLMRRYLIKYALRQGILHEARIRQQATLAEDRALQKSNSGLKNVDTPTSVHLQRIQKAHRDMKMTLEGSAQADSSLRWKQAGSEDVRRCSNEVTLLSTPKARTSYSPSYASPSYRLNADTFKLEVQLQDLGHKQKQLESGIENLTKIMQDQFAQMNAQFTQQARTVDALCRQNASILEQQERFFRRSGFPAKQTSNEGSAPASQLSGSKQAAAPQVVHGCSSLWPKSRCTYGGSGGVSTTEGAPRSREQDSELKRAKSRSFALDASSTAAVEAGSKTLPPSPLVLPEPKPGSDADDTFVDKHAGA